MTQVDGEDGLLPLLQEENDHEGKRVGGDAAFSLAVDVAQLQREESTGGGSVQIQSASLSAGGGLTLAQWRKASTSGTSLGSSLARAARWLVVRQATSFPAVTLQSRPLQRKAGSAEAEGAEQHNELKYRSVHSSSTTFVRKQTGLLRQDTPNRC